MTETLNVTSSLSQATQKSSDVSQNGDFCPILSQPVSSLHEVLEMGQEERSQREKSEDYCCCVKNMSFLFRCIGWWCELIGKCIVSWCEGFIDCINSCFDCNETQNGGNDCCFGGGCDECQGYSGDYNSDESNGDNGYVGDVGYIEDNGYIGSDGYNEDNGYDGGDGYDGGTCDDGGGGYDGGTCDDGGGGYDGGDP